MPSRSLTQRTTVSNRCLLKLCSLVAYTVALAGLYLSSFMQFSAWSFDERKTVGRSKVSRDSREFLTSPRLDSRIVVIIPFRARASKNPSFWGFLKVGDENQSLGRQFESESKFGTLGTSFDSCNLSRCGISLAEQEQQWMETRICSKQNEVLGADAYFEGKRRDCFEPK